MACEVYISKGKARVENSKSEIEAAGWSQLHYVLSRTVAALLSHPFLQETTPEFAGVRGQIRLGARKAIEVLSRDIPEDSVDIFLWCCNTLEPEIFLAIPELMSNMARMVCQKAKLLSTRACSLSLVLEIVLGLLQHATSRHQESDSYLEKFRSLLSHVGAAMVDNLSAVDPPVDKDSSERGVDTESTTSTYSVDSNFSDEGILDGVEGDKVFRDFAVSSSHVPSDQDVLHFYTCTVYEVLRQRSYSSLVALQLQSYEGCCVSLCSLVARVYASVPPGPMFSASEEGHFLLIMRLVNQWCSSPELLGLMKSSGILAVLPTIAYSRNIETKQLVAHALITLGEDTELFGKSAVDHKLRLGLISALMELAHDEDVTTRQYCAFALENVSCHDGTQEHAIASGAVATVIEIMAASPQSDTPSTIAFMPPLEPSSQCRMPFISRGLRIIDAEVTPGVSGGRNSLDGMQATWDLGLEVEPKVSLEGLLEEGDSCFTTPQAQPCRPTRPPRSIDTAFFTQG